MKSDTDRRIADLLDRVQTVLCAAPLSMGVVTLIHALSDLMVQMGPASRDGSNIALFAEQLGELVAALRVDGSADYSIDEIIARIKSCGRDRIMVLPGTFKRLASHAGLPADMVESMLALGTAQLIMTVTSDGRSVHISVTPPERPEN